MKFTFATVLLFAATALSVGPDALVTLHEAEPNTAFGSTNHGKVIKGADGKDITTLISFTVPNTGTHCSVNFSNWSVATGSETIALYSFVPNEGDTFNANTATFNSKTGFRDHELKIFVAGSSNPIYSFTCPPAGTIVNYEAVPSNGETDVEWFIPGGGFSLTAF
jgi:hypothetical protein